MIFIRYTVNKLDRNQAQTVQLLVGLYICVCECSCACELICDPKERQYEIVCMCI